MLFFTLLLVLCLPLEVATNSAGSGTCAEGDAACATKELFAPVRGSYVKVLEGTNFSEVTGDSDTASLVQFFSTKSISSNESNKKRLKTWMKLARALEGVCNVCVVDSDNEAGLVKQFNVRSFPAIRIYSPYMKTWIAHSGKRSFNALMKAAALETPS